MLLIVAKYSKPIAWFYLILLYLNLILLPSSVRGSGTGNYSFQRLPDAGLWKKSLASKWDKVSIPLPDKAPTIHQKAETVNAPASEKRVFTTGPTQPEMQAFSSVNSNNMVDLFTGDFSYNIPLLDVGGYPVNLSYRAGISMDQEASWVGLGWNINPGTVSRNMRGLPDEFSGKYDSVKKTMSIRENKTVGVTIGGGVEVKGLPIDLTANGGVFKNSYRGWGVEYGINASINSGNSAKGLLTAGLGITNNSQEGMTINPSLSFLIAQKEHESGGNTSSGSFSVSLPYNSRYGIKGLQLSAGVRQYGMDAKNQQRSVGSSFNTAISFASPSFTPSISIPYTSRQVSFTGKLGGEQFLIFTNLYTSGYSTRQFIAEADRTSMLPSYGYLNYQDANNNPNALLDFNREKELPYREKPAMPHIALPIYTYDAFSITGEGISGMFRGYRGDVGVIQDHLMQTRDESDGLSAEFGAGGYLNIGVDLNVNRAYTQSGAWMENNVARKALGFKKSSELFESVYFRNPGEKSITSKEFYEAVGGDDVVAIQLYQPSRNSSSIAASNYLTRFRNKRFHQNLPLTAVTTAKPVRDKRTQVITSLTASEAQHVGFSKFIENHTVNAFDASVCEPEPPTEGIGTGLVATYFSSRDWTNPVVTRSENVNIHNHPTSLPAQMNGQTEYFSTRWVGRLKAPATGSYKIRVTSDDGAWLWIRDSLIHNGKKEPHPPESYEYSLNLIKDEFYDVRLDYRNFSERYYMILEWTTPLQAQYDFIPLESLYAPQVDTIKVNNFVVRERRINSFRKPNHLSEINVLNNDGRRYVYGIPVYNLKQKEASFAVLKTNADPKTGLVKYTHNTDNTTGNQNGKDYFFSSEEMPAYAHSFLLTAILSSDYVDVTGNGVSADDYGDAVKFNYSKVNGIKNPFRWRAPAAKDSATYNEGLKADDRDDKGSYV